MPYIWVHWLAYLVVYGAVDFFLCMFYTKCCLGKSNIDLNLR